MNPTVSEGEIRDGDCERASHRRVPLTRRHKRRAAISRCPEIGQHPVPAGARWAITLTEPSRWALRAPHRLTLKRRRSQALSKQRGIPSRARWLRQREESGRPRMLRKDPIIIEKSARGSASGLDGR